MLAEDPAALGVSTRLAWQGRRGRWSSKCRWRRLGVVAAVVLSASSSVVTIAGVTWSAGQVTRENRVKRFFLLSSSSSSMRTSSCHNFRVLVLQRRKSGRCRRRRPRGEQGHGGPNAEDKDDIAGPSRERR
ncbi:hypothetical protein L226DRAFT_161594 [Lentinus tigrinus ALCF2SS1-7]|uniref:Uncharacterized protein n=1 Tax=Lentinus tigrinus ALCF2SS1-6 TaxID=1328759 RepID=A0A5C2S1W5_9APHY|nr:hypothetical protein L227DRAFT_230345 [Lentinus tigrinus ALCF2SS1-6]RPD72081.1 hypothetical protein L226DRAFT_161594 [Lentinus tigrinus ALCF2SS1-7]